jgi:lipooligosaccharide transport system permease protein
LIRSLTLGNVGIEIFGHVLYFLVMIALGLWFTTVRLKALFMK